MFLFQFNKKMPLFSGEDSFYHVGMAKYIIEQDIPQHFPYLKYTILNDKFVDHQLLFHLILIPFIKLFGENAGPKIMECLFFAASFGLLFLIFRKLNLKPAFLYPLILLFVMPSDFYFRMGFIRVQAVALFFMLFTFYLILINKPVAIFILAFLFVWLYGGSVFLPVILICYLISELLTKEKINWRIFIFGISGFIAGIIVNPFFPKNISFLYSQIFLTGIGAKPYSGGEWQPYDTWYWISISAIPVTIYFSGIFLKIISTKKTSAFVLSLFLFSFFLLILEWKSKRFVEYWPLFAGLVGFIFLEEYFISIFKYIWKTNLRFALGTVGLIFFTTAVFYKANIEISRAYNDTQTPINVEAAKEVHKYLINNSSPGDVVFTDDWDVFPFYFFFNRKDNYIVGLDPEFMNQYNHTLYEEYADISSGRDGNNLERIKNDFSAKWVLVASDHPQFKFNLLRNPDLFFKVYSNEEYTVLKVK